MKTRVRCTRKVITLLHIRQDIQSKLLINCKISENLEGDFVELNFRQKTRLVWWSYNPLKLNIMKHQDIIDLYSSRYKNYLLLGDFSSEPSENAIIEFCKACRLKNLVKGATCYKNLEKPSF